MTRPLDAFFEDAMEHNEFTILPITLAHASVLSSLPLHHRDPFDRMLIAQAIAEDVPIVSADAAFDAYPVERLW